MPLMILIAAIGLWYWTSIQNQRQTEVIRQRVLEICNAAAAGADLTGRLNPTDPFAEQQTIQAIRRVCDGPASHSKLEVAVRPGDVQGMGQAAPNVTHTAMLRKDGVDQLGLRLQFVPDTSEVRIVGYWLPQAASGP